MATREMRPAQAVKQVVDEEQEAGKRSKRWLLVALIILAALLTVIAVACWYALLILNGHLSDEAPTGECELVDEYTLAHLITEQEEIRVPSDDFRTLVKFVGSIKYASGGANDTSQPNHLLLGLKSVELKGNGANNEQVLVLVTSCARLILHLASDTHQLVVGSIELETAHVGDHWRACQIGSTDIALNDVRNRRYTTACTRSSVLAQMRYDCRWGFWRDASTFVQRPVLQLRIHSFEFEVDGRIELIRQNSFSKPRMVCQNRPE